MIRALLIDDEIANTNNLTAMLRKYCPQVTILGTANTIEQAEDLIMRHRPNLLFLDIQMGSHTGFDLLQNINKIDFQVIFVTAYNQYGIQAIKHAALDYLLKPIDIDELKQAVAKAEEKINSLVQKSQVEFLIQQWGTKSHLPKKIALSFQNETRYIPIVDIVRCEADDTYTIFHMLNEPKIIVSKPLKEYTEILTPHGFLRTHQSHLINPRFIKSWLKEDGGTILLTN
ncbi:two component transcriptional regulator, LytTR family [Sphingobacterium nematocida]|uniref:Two component transcriptional regulator, LytTR family n=1 Tax=Sphingobacterium nematocida TaxID=1513896 RepID=A0A1T5D0I5_9SPHI|nr:LytTR family DNA-binding domain-containing protein [Sphingobacterium nematocida]SKB65116.1 two component transcriptional regulator, LytTR family [Sphingobacterium nematocida]